MANESILISEVIPASPQRIFSAWLDSAEHSAFTGSQASVVPSVGGDHTAWDGYVQGRTLELHDGARIVQSWRTTEFPADSPDSRLEITLEPTVGGTLVTLLHTDIPSGQSDRYREGWNQYYLSRMKTYFAESGDASDDDLDEDEPTMPLGRTSGDFEATEVVTQFSTVDDDDEPTQQTTEAATEAKAQKSGTKSATKSATKNATTTSAKISMKGASLQAAARKSTGSKLSAAAKGKQVSKNVSKKVSKKVSKNVVMKAGKKASKSVGKALKTATSSARKSALKMAAKFVKKAVALTAKSRVAKKSASKAVAKGKGVVKAAAKRAKAKAKKSIRRPGKKR